METKKISVIVPMYNVEKNLPLCLDSLYKQTYKNLEILLVDDGSPDKCGQLAEEYAKKDARAIVLHKKNGGLSDARNAGIEVATGDYISFLDSDDFIHPKMFERLAELLETNQADVSICGFKYVGESQAEQLYDTLCQENIQETNGENYSGLEAQYVYYDQKDLRLSFTVAWAKLYKREMWQGKQFPVGKLHEDEYTTYKRLYAAEKIVYSDEQLYFYLVRDTSIMGGTFKKNRLDILQAFLERAAFYRSEGLNDLWTRAVFHGIHMSAQLQIWSEGQYKEEFRGFRTNIKEELAKGRMSRTDKVNKGMGAKKKLDLFVFLYVNPAYVCALKLLKRFKR